MNDNIYDDSSCPLVITINNKTTFGEGFRAINNCWIAFIWTERLQGGYFQVLFVEINFANLSKANNWMWCAFSRLLTHVSIAVCWKFTYLIKDYYDLKWSNFSQPHPTLSVCLIGCEVLAKVFGAAFCLVWLALLTYWGRTELCGRRLLVGTLDQKDCAS